MGIVLVHVSVADDSCMSITHNPAFQTDHIEHNLLTLAGYYVSPSLYDLSHVICDLCEVELLYRMPSISLRG
jgi:hypothetical protein